MYNLFIPERKDEYKGIKDWRITEIFLSLKEEIRRWKRNLIYNWQGCGEAMGFKDSWVK